MVAFRVINVAFYKICCMPVVHKKLLSIAFAGKRSHAGLASMQGPLNALFTVLEQAYPGTHLQLLSGLADGADQIVASVFMEGHAANKPGGASRLLGAVIPLPLHTYINTIHDKTLFHRLYDQCSYRLHLDGCAQAAGDGRHDYKEAYRQQARLLPRMGDIFLATAGRQEEGEKGGTKEAILAALTGGKPVVLLNLDDLQFYFYHTIDDWYFADALPLAPAAIVEQCALVYQKDVFISAEAEPKDLLFLLRRAVWNFYESLFRKNKPAPGPEDELKDLHNAMYYQIEAHRKKASESSKYFMFQYRGGYLLNYFLAITAIFIAVDASTVHFFHLEKLLPGEQRTKNSLLLLDVLKVGVILLIVYNTRRINRHHYNAKAIRFRYTAERLRIMSYFSLLGILRIPKPFLGNHVNAHMRDYQGESVFRRIISDLVIHTPLLSFALNTAYLAATTRFIKKHWLEGQLAYYSNDQLKMKRMDEQLVKIPEWLGKIVLVIVLIEIVEQLLPEQVHQHQVVAVWINWMVPVLIAATILLPGIVTTINSMHFQTEAKRLAFRNEIMYHQLKKIVLGLEQEIERLDQRAEGNNLLNVLLQLDEAARLTTDEVAEWTMIYEKPVFEPG